MLRTNRIALAVVAALSLAAASARPAAESTRERGLADRPPILQEQLLHPDSRPRSAPNRWVGVLRRRTRTQFTWGFADIIDSGARTGSSSSRTRSTANRAAGERRVAHGAAAIRSPRTRWSAWATAWSCRAELLDEFIDGVSQPSDHAAERVIPSAVELQRSQRLARERQDKLLRRSPGREVIFSNSFVASDRCLPRDTPGRECTAG